MSLGGHLAHNISLISSLCQPQCLSNLDFSLTPRAMQQTMQARDHGNSPRLIICPYQKQPREGAQKKPRGPFYKNKLEFTAELDALGSLAIGDIQRKLPSALISILNFHYSFWLI